MDVSLSLFSVLQDNNNHNNNKMALAAASIKIMVSVLAVTMAIQAQINNNKETDHTIQTMYLPPFNSNTHQMAATNIRTTDP